MKRFAFVVFCMAFFSSLFAQKSYIHIFASNLYSDNKHELFLSGDIPSGIQKIYYGSDYVRIGDVLNKLSKLGYEVEFMSPPVFNRQSDFEGKMVYLLSKRKSDDESSVRLVKDNEDTEAYEIARFNLQGMPISKNEKGLQIIVYSNYTTKTVFKQ